MVHYKVTYFEGRGAGEIIRQCLVLAGQEFEDVRLSDAEWEKQKDNMPFHQLPVLEEDGKQLAQSYTAARYVARKYGFSGKTAWEEAQVDALVDQWKDFRKDIYPLLSVLLGYTDGNLALLKEEHLPTVRKNFTFFVNALKESGSGFLAASGLTYVDLPIAEFIQTVEEKYAEILKEFPELVEHKKKVQAVPAIKQWRETRPKSDCQMVHYKLCAFQGRGTAEPIRQIFALAGVDFENDITDWYKWTEEDKKSVPFGQLPVLVEDGKQLPQSGAILRYVARKFGFAGTTRWEEAQVDAYADQWKDFNTELKPLLYTLIYKQPGDLEGLKKEYLPSLYKHLDLFKKAMKENLSGFIVGSSVTYIDLPLAEFTFNILNRDASLLKDYPELIQHKEKVQSISALKNWIEERPKTDW